MFILNTIENHTVGMYNTLMYQRTAKPNFQQGPHRGPPLVV